MKPLTADDRRMGRRPGIGWRILLTATLSEPPDPGAVRAGCPPSRPVDCTGAPRCAATTTSTRRARPHRGVGRPRPRPGRLRPSRRRRRARAARILLSSAGTAGDVRRPAAWATARPAGVVGTAARRLAEAAFRPPARIAPQPAAGRRPTAGDVMAELERARLVPHRRDRARAPPGHPRHNDAAGPAPHVAVAVGATRDPRRRRRDRQPQRPAPAHRPRGLDLPVSSERCGKPRSSGRRSPAAGARRPG